jgi:CDK-activating kinase assembly factor MAT1
MQTANRCQACVNRIFAMGAAPCPFCKVILRKTNFVKPTFEDLEVEKEVRIRRRIYKMYVYTNDFYCSITKSRFNKRIEDFAGDKMTFNSYLEEVEDIIHNLVHEHDVQLQNARIEEYLRANAASIQKNIDRQRDEDNAIFRALEEEIRDYHLRKKADDNELIQEMQNLSSKKHLNMSSTEVDTTILQNKSVVSQVLRRGPALMDRLNVNISAGRKSHFVADNPFSDPLKSPYLRFNNLTCAHLSFYDP